MTGRPLGLMLGGAAAALALCALLAPAAAEITFLFDASLPPNPYFVPEHGLRLYVVSPLFAATSVAMLLIPGVFLVLAFAGKAPGTWASVIARGFLVCFGGRVALHSLAKLLGTPLTPAMFWSLEVLLLTGTGLCLVFRWQRGAVGLPKGPALRLVLILLLPALVALVLTPLIYWQDFTEDGIEALEIGRSLGHYILPRFPSEPEFLGLGVGMVSMAPVVSWFVQILGPTEAAARLPLVLYLPVVALILMALAEHGGPGRLKAIEQGIILLVLAAMVAVMAYSATYDTYAADLSAPTAFETLTLTCLAGALLGLWEGRRFTFLAFVLLGYLARPTALLLVLLLAGVTFILFKGKERRSMLWDIALGIVVCAITVTVYEKVYLHLASGGTLGYAAENVVSRYQYLRFMDLRRFLWVMIPGGFIPFLSLLLFRRHDRFGLQLSVVLLLYFAAFFFPAFVALHHFVPVMVLPVVPFLRLGREAPRWVLPLASAACIAGFGLSLPHYLHVDRSSRLIGTRMAYDVGEYGGDPAEHREAVSAAATIFQLFPAIWDVEDPSETHVGAPTAFLYYSARAGVRREEADYAILERGASTPEGFFEVGSEDRAVAYARNADTWRKDLSTTPPIDFGNPLFVLPRETLFHFVGAPTGEYDADLARLPFIWRFF